MSPAGKPLIRDGARVRIEGAEGTIRREGEYWRFDMAMAECLSARRYFREDMVAGMVHSGRIELLDGEPATAGKAPTLDPDAETPRAPSTRRERR